MKTIEERLAEVEREIQEIKTANNEKAKWPPLLFPFEYERKPHYTIDETADILAKAVLAVVQSAIRDKAGVFHGCGSCKPVQCEQQVVMPHPEGCPSLQDVS